MKKYSTASEAGLARARSYADGGAVGLAAPGMAATDEPITERDVKTWGSARNARAAADARKNARERPVSDTEAKQYQQQMGRKNGGRV